MVAGMAETCRWRITTRSDWTYLLTYLFKTWSRVLLENLTGFQLVKKFPAFNGTRKFITALTRASDLSLSWATSTQSMPPTSHFLKIHLNVILPSTPGSPKWSLFFRFPYQNPVHTSLPLTRYMPYPLNLLDFNMWLNIFTNVRVCVCVCLCVC